MTYLEKAIISAIAYFDLFDYPLTSFEVWRWLYTDSEGENVPCPLRDVLRAFAKSQYLHERLEFREGYYFLKGRGDIVVSRQSRYRIAEKKYLRARKLVKALSMIPFVRMIAVCNKLGYNNNTLDSDIDVFIICAQGRLWFTRLMVTLVTQFAGMRRHGINISQRVCLSFYLSTSRLSIHDLAKTPSDPYLSYWISHLYPLFGADTYHAFMEANRWVQKTLPNLQSVSASPRRTVGQGRQSRVQRMFEIVFRGPLGAMSEKIAKSVQMKRIARNPDSHLKEHTSDVVVDDTVLKFHEQDRRIIFRRQFEQQCSRLL